MLETHWFREVDAIRRILLPTMAWPISIFKVSSNDVPISGCCDRPWLLSRGSSLNLFLETKKQSGVCFGSGSTSAKRHVVVASGCAFLVLCDTCRTTRFVTDGASLSSVVAQQIQLSQKVGWHCCRLAKPPIVFLRCCSRDPVCEDSACQKVPWLAGIFLAIQRTTDIIKHSSNILIGKAPPVGSGYLQESSPARDSWAFP